MKKIFILTSVLTVMGCSNSTENATKELVKSKLKDPASAQFQNVKENCGEVNSKNSYGGYVGFKRYVSLDGSVIMESDDLDPLIFELGWTAYCVPNKSSLDEKKSCLSDAYNQSLILDAKNKGVSSSQLKDDILKSGKSKEEITEALQDIEKAYNSNFKSKDQYAIDVLNKCLKPD